MPTAQSFIDDALVDIRVIAPGETPSTDERNYALRVINQVLDNWSAEGLPIPEITREEIAVTGDATYALATRPIKIRSALVSHGSTTVELTLVTAEEWAAGAGTSAHPALWYDGGFTTATVYIRPAPSSGTIETYSYIALTTFTLLSTNLAFPTGYELPLRRALGLELAQSFGKELTDKQIALANNAKTSILGLNAAVLGQPKPIGTPAQ